MPGVWGGSIWDQTWDPTWPKLEKHRRTVSDSIEITQGEYSIVGGTADRTIFDQEARSAYHPSVGTTHYDANAFRTGLSKKLDICCDNIGIVYRLYANVRTVTANLPFRMVMPLDMVWL